MRKFIFLFIIFSFQFKNVLCNHIIGGELSYKKVGFNAYEITLKIYRDCNAQNAAPFDDPANVAIYENGILLNNIEINLQSTSHIEPTELASCILVPTDACVEKGLYVKTVNLNSSSFGYDLVYTRCCRNGSIVNINTPNETGSTYSAFIPPSQTAATNSNPVFSSLPPIFVCLNTPFEYDHSATDLDGDSISYYFCTPYAGASSTSPLPIPADPPPFQTVNWLNPFSTNNQLSSNPNMSINPTTGQLSLNPSALGQYVVGVCAAEFRNGVFLSESKRDFQFNVTNCYNPVANITSQSALTGSSSLCGGLTINFINSSANSTNYRWDFGVPGITSDTSNLLNPTYTFPNPGNYTIRLIANNIFNDTLSCFDTTTAVFQVYPILDPDFVVPPPQCLSGNSFDFLAGGIFDPSATFNWNFGPNANPSTFVGNNANNISFDIDSLIEVKLIVNQFVCSDTVIKNVEVFPEPIADIGDADRFCVGLAINFENETQNQVGNTYSWNFGVPGLTNDTSNLYAPNFIYPDTGIYNVQLKVTTINGCSNIASLPFLVYQLFTPGIYPFNDSNFVNQCLDLNYFNFFADGIFSPTTNILWQFGPSASTPTSNQTNPQGIVFSTAGNFPVSVTYSENGCEKSFVDTVRVYNQPKINFSVSINRCAPFSVQYVDGSTADTPIKYYWSFGDSGSSNLPSPLHFYENAGIYHPMLKIITTSGCKDTLVMEYNDSIRFIPPPNPGLEIEPLKVSIFEPIVNFTDISSNNISSVIYLGDGTIKTEEQFSHQYQDTGTYKVLNVVINEDGCRDTAFYDVVVFPEFRLWIPNSFTPNKDNLNDEFLPINIGIKEYQLIIFDRWGSIVFSTKDPNESWKGKINNTDIDAPVGVYTYNIDALNVLKDFISKKGMIVLNR